MNGQWLRSIPQVRMALFLGALISVTALGGLADAETIERDGVRIGFSAAIRPHSLPRRSDAPLSVSVGVKLTPTHGEVPPQLRKIALAINNHGHFHPDGLPVCHLNEIQPATTSTALQACRSSLVGKGSFSAKVLLLQQSPFPSNGTVYAFNGRYHGAPAIFAHVYGTEPVPTSFTLPFTLRPARGTFGTVLTAALPAVTSQWGYVTGIQISLGRRLGSRGASSGYLTGSCPAPKGFSTVPFPLARGTYSFTGQPDVHITVNRSCRVRG